MQLISRYFLLPRRHNKEHALLSCSVVLVQVIKRLLNYTAAGHYFVVPRVCVMFMEPERNHTLGLGKFLPLLANEPPFGVS